VKTRKGFHIITYGFDFGTEDLKEREKRCLIARKWCGDDPERIKHDMNPKRFKQVLFTNKKVDVFRKSKPRILLYCFSCHKPLIHHFIYDFKTRRFFCSEKCMNQPYKYEVRTKLIFKILNRLGIKTERVDESYPYDFERLIRFGGMKNE